MKQECSAEEIGCIIIEPVQGEGGYNIATKSMIREIRAITQEKRIPFIIDEVQSGLGRTGKWWASEHYNIKPDIMSAAKALQVGATIANKKWFPEEGAISSTWGGGHIIDLAIGTQIIKTIKKKKLLNSINKQGNYLKKRIQELEKKYPISNTRGFGLMLACDLPTKKMRDDLIIECLKRGLVLLGCGEKSIRIIPPYIISEREINEAINITERALQQVKMPKFKHRGEICNYITCGEVIS